MTASVRSATSNISRNLSGQIHSKGGSLNANLRVKMTKSLHSLQILTSLPKIALQIELCGMEQEVMDGCIKPQMQRWAGIEVFGATEVRVCIVEKTDRVRSFIVIGNLFGGPVLRHLDLSRVMG